MHLSDKALLVHLSASQWMGRKLDRKASNQVADLNQAHTSAGRYTKYLLPSCSELKNVHSKTALIRKEFYKNTLPWGIEGTYILPSANYMEFIRAFRKEKLEWEQLFNDFMAKYADAVGEAQRMLGDMFDHDQYPDPSSIVGKFALDLTFMPVPSAGDFRVELIDDELATVVADVEERVANAQNKAMKEVWSRLYAHVEKFAERLSDPTNTFHDTMVDNARETCDLLKRLNVTGDANLDKMRREVADKLASFHPDTLRFDPDVRKQAAADAAAIKSAMGAFMNGVG